MNQYKSEDMFVLADKLKELRDRKSELEERPRPIKRSWSK